VASAQYCDCGHEFVPGSKPTDWTPAKVSESPKLFTLKHLLQCWAAGAGVAAMLTFAVFSSPTLLGLFGVFMLPLWTLPTFVNRNFSIERIWSQLEFPRNLLLMVLGGSLFYGVVCFTVLGLVMFCKKLKRVSAS
jgi:hypothetical protein